MTFLFVWILFLSCLDPSPKCRPNSDPNWGLQQAMELKPKWASRWRPSLLPRKAHRALVCMFFSFFKQHVQWLFSSASTCISTRHVEPPLQLPYTPPNGPRPSLHVAPCHHSVHVQVTPAWPNQVLLPNLSHTEIPFLARPCHLQRTAAVSSPNLQALCLHRVSSPSRHHHCQHDQVASSLTVSERRLLAILDVAMQSPRPIPSSEPSFRVALVQ